MSWYEDTQLDAFDRYDREPRDSDWTPCPACGDPESCYCTSEQVAAAETVTGPCNQCLAGPTDTCICPRGGSGYLNL